MRIYKTMFTLLKYKFVAFKIQRFGKKQYQNIIKYRRFFLSIFHYCFILYISLLQMSLRCRNPYFRITRRIFILLIVATIIINLTGYNLFTKRKLQGERIISFPFLSALQIYITLLMATIIFSMVSMP